MGLFRIIRARISSRVQAVLFYNALIKETNNILPINMGFLTLLGKDYLRGYPASFYILFDNAPKVRLSIFDLLEKDKKIAAPFVYNCISNQAQEIEFNKSLISAFALYSRVKHYTENARIMCGNLRLWGPTYYVQDDEYVYDTMLLHKLPIESFNNLYNPKNIEDITDDPTIALLNSELTHNINQAKEDYFEHADTDVLDNIYEEAVKSENINDITELRKAQVEEFFKDMEYEYDSGIKYCKV